MLIEDNACVCQAVPHLDAGPPLHTVVSLPAGLSAHELLLRRPSGGQGGPTGAQPPTGGYWYNLTTAGAKLKGLKPAEVYCQGVNKYHLCCALRNQLTFSK